MHFPSTRHLCIGIYIIYAILSYHYYQFFYELEIDVFSFFGGNIHRCRLLSQCRLYFHIEFILVVINLATIIMFMTFWAPYFYRGAKKCINFIIEMLNRQDHEPEYEPD